MSNPITYLTTSELDRDKTLLLVDASIQAYNAFYKDDMQKCAECNSGNIKPPSGYDFVDYWTGVDAFFHEFKRVECYGIVLRSQTPPYTYIFAFRGTDGIYDLIDDFGADDSAFVAHNKTVSIPADVAVESGFYHIYADSDDKTASMQSQVFALVDKYQASDKPIAQLYSTGHSLGCTLSTLFVLDMALCRPEVKVSSYNYASPRVGNPAFVSLYEQQTPQQNPETRTLRIQNIYDKIPCTPMHTLEGYQHLPYGYLVSFYPDRLAGKLAIIDNHSVQNYRTVLEGALASETGVFEATFKGYKDVTMKSVQPDPKAVCSHW